MAPLSRCDGGVQSCNLLVLVQARRHSSGSPARSTNADAVTVRSGVIVDSEVR